jgi:hypothetical protein
MKFKPGLHVRAGPGEVRRGWKELGDTRRKVLRPEKEKKRLTGSSPLIRKSAFSHPIPLRVWYCTNIKLQ